MKICIIGAGSTYTPELIEGIINKRDSLPVSEISFMDIDERKLNIVGSLCQRMIVAAGLNCKTELVLNDYEHALKGADFVLAQIRVGKLPARVKDEKIPLKYDLIGQETCGIGGMFKGLRTIPVMIQIVKMMEMYCPNAWLINFSNPSGMIAEALLNYTNVKMMGLCNVPINTIDGIKKSMNLPNAEVEYMGLNHFAYITKIEQDGKDYLEDALAAGINSESMKNIPASGFTKEQIEYIGAIPTSYLEYYYFKNSKLEKLKNSPKTRGEICMEIEEELLKIDKTVYGRESHEMTYAWKLENVIKYDKPIPIKGKLGLWNYEEENMHEMRLHNAPFELIKNGTKTIEIRLNDEKRSLIKEGDIIEFENRATKEKLKTKVIKLHKFGNFEELYKHFDKISLGYAEDEIADPKDMEQYYPQDKQEKYGVLGIEIEVLE